MDGVLTWHGCDSGGSCALQRLWELGSPSLVDRGLVKGIRYDAITLDEITSAKVRRPTVKQAYKVSVHVTAGRMVTCSVCVLFDVVLT